MRYVLMTLAAAAGVALLVGAFAWAEDDKIPIDKLPKPVLDALKAKFPKGELVSAEKEDEDGKVVYEVVVKLDGATMDVKVSPEGKILEIEKELKELPKAAADALAKKYPKYTLKKAEEVTKGETVTYEAVIITADKKEIEVTFDAAGKIIEEEDKKEKDEDEFTKDFSAEKADLTHTGKNPYFILEPGYQLVLEDGKERVVITVLNETKMVDGVECRVVEERETKDGKLVEVSRNFFAISKRTNSVYYFGEEVDIYKDGKVVKHDGAWLSGKDGAKFGLAMPGLPLLDAKYYQEVAPGVAMDRAEVVGLGLTVKTPAGEFKNCLKIEETTPLEKGEKEYKVYAPGVGLIIDGDAKLVKFGKAATTK